MKFFHIWRKFENKQVHNLSLKRLEVFFLRFSLIKTNELVYIVQKNHPIVHITVNRGYLVPTLRVT